MQESSLKKRHKKSSEPVEIPTAMPSSLTDERRLEIIEEILKDLSQKNVLDEIRRANAIPFRLPRYKIIIYRSRKSLFFYYRDNQMQKNVAERIRDLTGSEIIMLNDHLYMKNLCKRLDEKHKVLYSFFLNYINIINCII